MRIKDDSWLKNAPIAHRGLHDSEFSENTMGAFEKAMRAGFPIETDIHVTKDNEVVVFHDDTLTRATKGEDNRKVEDLTLQQLKEVKIFGAFHMPTLQELLDVVKGRVPLLIEFKKSAGSCDNLEECANVILSGYQGEYAVQSFNPTVLTWYKQHNPDVLRGQLSSFFGKNDLSFIKKFVLKRMWFNKTNQPDFVSYDGRFLPNKYVDKFVKTFHGAVLAWTVRSRQEYEKVQDCCDNIIFENFLPLHV